MADAAVHKTRHWVAPKYIRGHTPVDVFPSVGYIKGAESATSLYTAAVTMG